jgi:CRISPR/Cas system-associated exonuclease Cas4 (RecB family)
MTGLPLFEPVVPDPASEVSLRIIVSSSAAARLSRAREAVRRRPPGNRVLIVGASRAAADDLARDVAVAVPSSFGIERLSITQLAAKTALLALATSGASASTSLGAEAVAVRAVFEATREDALRYFGPVAATPGFARALGKTLGELRLAGTAGTSLAPLPLAGPDLAVLLDGFNRCFTDAKSVDRAGLFRAAARSLRPHAGAGRGFTGEGQARAAYDLVVFLDISLTHAAERDLVAAVVTNATMTLATVPYGDHETIRHLVTMGGAVEEVEREGPVTDLGYVDRFLFDADSRPPMRDLDGSLTLFSAPGEGRECVEIARRVLSEARAGVRFDEIAVLVRSPQSYFGLLEHALRRAGVPAWFDRGTRRPHPAGRAFLALLTCAAEQLSAARFAEYLSLGQVPSGISLTSAVATDGSMVPRVPPVLPVDEAFGFFDQVGATNDASGAAEDLRTGDNGAAEGDVSATESADAAAVAETLQAPWRWEALLVEAAVIGHDASRWRRRLAGKAAELEAQATEAEREGGPDSGRAQSLRLVRQQLSKLQDFALPIVETLAAWPRVARWGEWLEHFSHLAPRVLRTPADVLRVLTDLQPMLDVGPVDLDEACRVLSERLLTLESAPPARRFGRIFVGTPDQARGRSFRVVFVPGVAERMFPQKPREDPILLDGLRVAVGGSLATQSDRLAAERLLLQMAAGAASDRLYVSYPRIDLSESRARVPSFYALDVMRAATGRVPDYEWLEARARTAGSATLAWPAPEKPADAIDEQEHDLAVLRGLLDERDRESVRGHAHYLLKLNESLRRSVVNRWARGEPRWSASDGLTRVSIDTADALRAQRPTVRSYSLSALQRFSACPYQFVLGAFYRLQPLEPPESLQRMDALTRGSLFHEIQARFFRALKDAEALPVTDTSVADAATVLDATVDAVATRAYDELAPVVDRVWNDEIAAIRRDLHGWLRYLARDGEQWLPTNFEFGFGAVPGERDVSSIRDEVTLPDGFKLRGAIDLIEEHRATKVLRVTDHKTGRTPDRIQQVIVGGGAVLQPVLYAMAVEAALGRRVSQGRLFYCTSTGGYTEHAIPLSDTTRAAGMEVLEVIDRAVATGCLAAAPTEDACGRCDFRIVCGPDMFRRTSRKPQDAIADLRALRSRP